MRFSISVRLIGLALAAFTIREVACKAIPAADFSLQSYNNPVAEPPVYLPSPSDPFSSKTSTGPPPEKKVQGPQLAPIQAQHHSLPSLKEATTDGIPTALRDSENGKLFEASKKAFGPANAAKAPGLASQIESRVFEASRGDRAKYEAGIQAKLAVLQSVAKQTTAQAKQQALLGLMQQRKRR